MNKKRVRPDPLIQYKILQSSHLEREMISQLYGIGASKAYEVIKKVREKYNYSNLLLSKPILVEKKHVLELYPLDIKGINKAHDDYIKEKTLQPTK